MPRINDDLQKLVTRRPSGQAMCQLTSSLMGVWFELVAAAISMLRVSLECFQSLKVFG